MNQFRKSSGVKLTADAYSKLRQEILQRDGWKCQFCGSMRQLLVHHLRFRSHSGDDAEHNLMTLCALCHAEIHLVGEQR